MASTRLRHTINSTGDRQKFTFSVWCKRSGLGDKALFVSGTESDEAGYFTIYFSGDAIRVRFYEGSAKDVVTSALYRDTSAWYHIVVKVDTTQATDANRVIIYVNGEEQDKASATYVTQNFNTLVNTSGEEHKLGVQENSVGSDSNYFDGLMAHYHLIDGTAYDASVFGETDATTGIWKAKTAPSVTYGTNGAFLKFENSGAMGTDSSGNGNDYTVLGTMTQTLDTPSNVFATMNPLNVPTSNAPTYSNGNLKGTSAALGKWIGSSTLGVSSGKWYMEVKVTEQSGSNSYIGVADEGGTAENAKNNENGNGNGILYKTNGQYRQSINGTTTDVSYGNSYTQGDIIGIALNCDDNEIVFYKNGTAQNSGTPISIPTPDGFLFLNIALGSGLDESFEVNFGNGYFGTTAVASANADDNGIGAFEYSPPTGYLALCTKNINEQEYS